MVTKSKINKQALGWINQNIDTANENESETNKDINDINLNDIEFNPDQPRKTFDDKEMQGLKESINEFGLLQSIVVKQIKNSNKYLLVAGERRVRACKLLNHVKIAAKITTDDQLMIGLIENIQRANLNPFEEAKTYEELIKKYNLTHEILGKKINKSRTVITEILGLNKIPDTIKRECINNKILSKATLVKLSKLDEQEMKNIIEILKNSTLSTVQIRKLIKNAKNVKLPIIFNKEIEQQKELSNILNTLIIKFENDPKEFNGLEKQIQILNEIFQKILRKK